METKLTTGPEATLSIIAKSSSTNYLGNYLKVQHKTYRQARSKVQF